MKETKVVTGCLLVILAITMLPVQIYMSWLLYQHVQATPLMWSLWWFQTPMLVIITLLSSIVKEFFGDKK